MDSCTDRIEKLLNRAGQTISDLPKRTADCMPYSPEQCLEAHREAVIWNREYGASVLQIDEQYILHLTDVIDRLEWALDKTLRELAYTRAKCCYICGLYEGKVRGEQLEDECEQREYCMEVYEDWREDDA